jgi:hypothetical protein
MDDRNVSNAGRREFLAKAGKAAAVAPAVAMLLSPTVMPTAAQAGYHRPKPHGPKGHKGPKHGHKGGKH